MNTVEFKLANEALIFVKSEIDSELCGNIHLYVLAR